ncbi:hypothetical protein L211DRAFT_284928 [Terfezia boudieri ATCC MYA-4762]|uniref:Uncharacterized protein n=1 Tax=Terfezia boudieri ATCC MYA-4762 TaxID=1051890 RepID=A0A3N4LZ40_9PEZI|nr:hypothetical protein L211DRAFT_284928 [Terfezia boudieri ATCC MYA-4762]
MKPSRVGRAGLPTPRHIILAGAPSQTSLLHSASSEVSQEYLPAFRRFFKLGGLTAAGPGPGPVPVGTLPVGACGRGDSISNRETPWRELLLKRKYPGTTDSEARRRRIVQNSGTIAEEGISAPKPPTLSQGLENTSPISSIVGIISTSQPILCRNKSEMVKLTVGDETASGVGVTIWLDSGSVDMRDKLCNNKVYLNSMRNGKTEIEVLYRCGERGGGYRPDLGQKKAVKDQQVEKVKRVVEWVESFVGVGGWNTAGAEDGDTTILPEDTQLSE